MKASMIDWMELEAQIGLEALPAFHRAFLVSRGVDVTGMMLRRVQQTVEREINKLVLEQRAKREDSQIWIDPGILSGLELADGRSLQVLLEQSLLEQLPRQP